MILPNDVYARVTERIIADLEKGVRPWQQPWAQGPDVSKPLRGNGVPYQGINVLMLWMEAMAQGYSSPYWLTYNQAVKNGGQILKGEKSTMIVYVSQSFKTRKREDGTEEEVKVPLLRTYNVFNADQIKYLPNMYYPERKDTKDGMAQIEAAESFFRQTHARVIHGGNEAYYYPAHDTIHLPMFASFSSVDGYYSTLAHETIHWTGHRSRLNRELKSYRSNAESYAVEELVAELGAAFLCADLGITLEVREDHSQYIATWLTTLKNNMLVIPEAAKHAQRAGEYLHSLQKNVVEREKTVQ